MGPAFTRSIPHIMICLASKRQLTEGIRIWTNSWQTRMRDDELIEIMEQNPNCLPIRTSC